MDTVKELFLATRPWSFTATFVPIAVTAAVVKTSLFSPLFFRALFMGLFVHSGANLTNTYYDYVHGIDSKHHNHDPTLVEKKVSPKVLYWFSIVCYALGVILMFPSLISQSGPHQKDMITIFSVGIVLSFFYTADPVGLKYRAMGDITIFLCFGPLLMQCTSLMLTGDVHYDLFYYTIPIGLLTEAILHANNGRDIKNDASNGIITLATLLGFELSYYFYAALFVLSYTSVLIISYYYHAGCLLSLLTIPLAIDLVKKFKAQNMLNLTEETAKMHLPFGIGLLIGILSTSQGLSSFL